MRDQTRSSLERVTRKGWEFQAGETVTAVDPDGVEHELQTIDVPKDSISGQGIAIDQAGIRDQAQRYLRFHQSYLSQQGIELTPAWHFMIDGERWDPSKDAAIETYRFTVRISIRKSVELNSSANVSEFTYEP